MGDGVLDEGNQNVHSSWREYKLVQPLCSFEPGWRFFKKLKIKLPYDPAIPLLGIHLDKTIIEKNTCTPVFTVAKTWRQPECPLTNEWMKKTWCICNGVLLSHKKNKITSFAATRMQPEITVLSEVSQRERDKYQMISLICCV